MGIINEKCVDNHQIIDEQPLTTFKKAMEAFNQNTILKNEYKLNKDDKISLLKELDQINYTLLDYVNNYKIIQNLYFYK